jgi:hypothetical protein
MDYWFFLYIFIAVGVCLGGVVFLIQSHRTLGGLLFLVGAILIFTFYGLRWFSGNVLRASKFNSTTWPPVINLCPDFLSLYPTKISGKNVMVCVDLIGVSKGSNGIKKFIDPSNVSDPRYTFNLSQDKKGSARLNALCQECKEKGVTWEGIYDGVSCQSPSFVPKTDGSSESTTDATQCK